MNQERQQRRDDEVQPGTQAINPGDEVPPGTAGAGENVCRVCGGTGRRGAQPCATCGGTGVVIEPVGGA